MPHRSLRDELVFCHPKRGTVYRSETFAEALRAALTVAGVEADLRRSMTSVTRA